MSTKTLKRKRIFSPSEIEQLRAELLEKRLGILPIEITETGYYYDPHELFQALEKKPPIDLNDNKIKL